MTDTKQDELHVEFNNVAPEDKEWTTHVSLLNKWTTPDRYLREIVIYARSGKHYPTDMHVDLIRQVFNTEVTAVLDRLEKKKFDWKLDENNSYQWVELSAIEAEKRRYE